jgi:hypothetical protein
VKKKSFERKKEPKSRPPEGTIKINIDAPFNVDQGSGSLGPLLEILLELHDRSSKELAFVMDPFMGEAYAMRECLSLYQHLGSNKVILQSYNIQVIETMACGGFSATSSATIFDDCRILGHFL